MLSHNTLIPECSLPIHCLMNPSGNRIRTKDLTTHNWSGRLPEKSLIRARPNVLVSTPGFAFLQMANELSRTELIFLAYELFGTYALPTGLRCIYREQPLLVKSQLISFLRQNQNVRGCKKALTAANLAIPNSASPMETITAMLLCLPYRMGGYGLPAPALNRRISIPDNYLRRASKQYFVCDMLWPEARLALEYDSDQYHTETQKITEDAIRRNDLEALGISVITVTSRQIFDFQRLNSLAHALARILGKRLRYSERTFSRNNEALLSMLRQLTSRHP